MAAKVKTVPDTLSVRGRAQVLFQALNPLQHQLATVETQVLAGALTLETHLRPDRTTGEEIDHLNAVIDGLVKNATPAEVALVAKLAKRHEAQIMEKDQSEDERLGLAEPTA